MKFGTIVVVFLFASLSYAEDETKTIRVDRTTFSAIYPAVWFSPSTGEISPLLKKSEIPPEEKFEIWIEPRDPELGYNPDKKPVGVGFALVGKGPEVFKNPPIPANPKLALKITSLIKEEQGTEQFVFYCKGKSATCLIMLTAIDRKEQVIQFTWRLLKKN